MSANTTGVYFNGKTSTPNAAILSIEKDILKIQDEISGEMISWSFDEITFNQIGKNATLEHKNHPFEKVVITDAAFVSQLYASLKKSGNVSLYYRLIHLGVKFYFLMALLILGLIGLTFLYVIPWAAEKAVVMIPEEYDNQLSDSFLLKSALIDDIDSVQTKNLNLFAKSLHLKNKKPLKFMVVRSDEVNAFALPDGDIVVYSGILKEMKSYEELVALLGHEVSHINNRHSMKALCRSLSGYIFISVILGDANGVMAVIGDNANNLQSLSFSRNYERQADQDGLSIMLANRVDPRGMVQLFSRLKDSSLGIVPEFLSTHPLTDERINNIQSIIRSNPNHFQKNAVLEEYFNRIKATK